MALVTLIANRNNPSREKATKLMDFFYKAEAIAQKYHFGTNSYNFLFSTAVGECEIVSFNFQKKEVEFEFACHSIYNGHSREKVTLEMEKFLRFAHELAEATGYSVVVQKPLYYDEDR